MITGIGELITFFSRSARLEGLSADTAFGLFYSRFDAHLDVPLVINPTFASHVAELADERDVSRTALIIGLPELSRDGDLNGLHAYVNCLNELGLIDDVDSVIALSGNVPGLDRIVSTAESALFDSTRECAFSIRFIHFIGTTAARKKNTHNCRTLYGDDVPERPLGKLTLANSGAMKACWSGEYPAHVVETLRNDAVIRTCERIRQCYIDNFDKNNANVIDNAVSLMNFYNSTNSKFSSDERLHAIDNFISLISMRRYDDLFNNESSLENYTHNNVLNDFLFFNNIEDIVGDISAIGDDAEEKFVEYNEILRNLSLFSALKNDIYLYPTLEASIDSIIETIDREGIKPPIDTNDIARFVSDYLWAIGYDEMLKAINAGIKAADLSYI